ncbi:NTP transferase domain-containing protein [Paenibacillus alkaliterrae]|uniref:mannose-1-phosphate guanylyltransferase n=1 Tax=Paenibacillus alkaliterrae TaxID=320909 RepID=UPI001F3FCC79|nr:sugar phosphate nucleotidyltransferase [Paenibacillus alkaliterrae]MCF2940170.1 NTP transferase domain-containing protein [Paenibacillus alkaliterrae]
MLKAVVLAGGSGSRLWPQSRPDLPKQFLPFLGDKSMFQKTLERLTAFLPLQDIYVVTLAKYEAIALEQSGLPASQLIIEPMAKNTAACIGLAAIHFLRKQEDPILITIPADHSIEGEEAFREALQQAYLQARREDCAVTLGVKPTRPETAYGYIKIVQENATDLFRVEKFTEKPDAAQAKSWMNQSGYYWNTGIMAWRASYIEALLTKYMPQLAHGLAQWKAAVSPIHGNLLHTIYEAIPGISIDYGILEKLPLTYLLPVSFRWDDLGSWSSLDRWLPQDADSNVVIGNHRLSHTKNCIVYSDHSFVGTIGVEQLIIVVTDNAVLVCHKDYEQKIREMLEHREHTD